MTAVLSFHVETDLGLVFEIAVSSLSSVSMAIIGFLELQSQALYVVSIVNSV